MKKKLNEYNVFRYIFNYIIVVILVISIIGGYLYAFFRKTVYTDFLAANEQYLHAITNRHENDMQIAQNIVAQIETMDNVTRFRLSENPENANELMKTLKGYTSVSQFFDLLFYFYHNDEYFYHQFSSVNVNVFEKYGASFSDISVKSFLDLAREKTQRVRFLPEQQIGGEWLKAYLTEERYVFLFYAVPPYLEDTLIFCIPESYYDELLAEGKGDGRLNFLYYDGQIIVTGGRVQVIQEELVELLEKEIKIEKQTDEQLQHEVTVASEEYLLSIQKGTSGIYYGTLQSMEVFHDKVMTEQWHIMMLILSCLLFAATIITVASKGFINKVKRWNELLNEDSYYDLNKIENGIQTLVNTYKEVEKEGLVLKKTLFIRNFIRGDFACRADAIAEAEKAKLDIDYDMYTVVLLRSREMAHENKVYAAMLDAINKEDGLEGYGTHLINDNQKLFVVYSSSQDAIENVLQNMLEIEKNFSQDYVIACSDYHTDFTEGAKAYLEAVNAFDNFLLLDNSKVIRFSDVAQKEYVSLLSESYLQRLKYAIRAGDKNAVEITVKDICSKLDEEKVSLYAFRIFCHDIIHVLLSELKGNRAQLYNFYNVFTLSQCLNIREFSDLLCEICNVIIDGYTGKAVKVSEMVEDAIAYMQKNFTDSNLTMNALAEYLDISSVTLSVVFKNDMDVKPSDYLANLRIEKAKELLRESGMPIREISQAVGYEDERVFLRRFKKLVGMTPGEYRTNTHKM